MLNCCMIEKMHFYDKIIFKLDYPFPKGDNPSINRIKSHLKGLYSQNCTTEVWSSFPNGFAPLRKIPLNFTTIINLSPFTKSGKILGMAISYSCATLLSIIYLMHYRISKKKLIIYTYFTDLFYLNVPLIVICKIIGYKMVLELTDHPFANNNSRLYRFLFKTITKYYDAVFVISNSLQDFVTKESHVNQNRVFILPMNVDTSRFDKYEPLPDYLKDELPDNYIGYCGSVNGAKEGIFTMLRVFKDISILFPDISFCIAGRGDPKDIDNLEREIAKLDLTSKVVLLKRVSSEYIPAFLRGAKILVMFRTSNIMTQYGFPTKLGEYLMSGRPIVLSDVSDLGNYMKDRYNSYLSDPFPAAFKEKLIEALVNYEQSISIGIMGKALAEEEFGHKIVSKKLRDYIYLL